MTTATTTSTNPLTSVRVESELFGTLSVPADVCLTFEDGLLGFAATQRFVLLPAAPDGVYWLQGVDEGSLVFMVIDPYGHVPGYSFSLSEVHRQATGATEDSETAVLGIVTLPRGKKDACTVNLQAPLFIDFSTRRGWQLVIADSPYATCHAIDLATTLDATTSSSP